MTTTDAAPVDSRSIQEMLVEWAQEHVDDDPEKLVLLPPDSGGLSPVTAEAQEPDSKLVRGNRRSAETIGSMATLADPRFPRFLDVMETQDDATGVVSTVGSLLENGYNVDLLTNHPKIKALGFVSAAHLIALDYTGASDYTTNVLVGKMPAFLGQRIGGEVVSMIDSLAIGFDNIFLVHPDTKSRLDHGITDEMAEPHNYGAIMHFIRTLRQRHNFTILDPYGDRGETKDINAPTKKLLSRPDTVLVLAGVHMDDEHCGFAIGDRAYSINDKTPQDPRIAHVSLPTLLDEWATVKERAEKQAETH